MPELPEVETVRDGLARLVVGLTVRRVEVFRDYSVRRHPGDPASFASALEGARIVAAVRRGKYLWLPLIDMPDDSRTGARPTRALLAHLGMSGQLLVRTQADPEPHPHLRVRLHLDGESDARVAATSTFDTVTLDFVDQRTFGHLGVVPLIPTPDALPGGHGSADPTVAEPVAHIARDLLDPAVARGTGGRAGLVAAIRRRRTGIKRALLDQGLVSGVGNIYADEALWRARLHFARATDALRAADVARVLDAAEDVMREALAVGGTSFDTLYVDVDGESGYFSRALVAYGREGEPCARCGTPIRRDAFMNRSSYSCPRCQIPAPRVERP